MKFTLVIPVAPGRGAEILDSVKELDYDKSKFHVIVVKGKNPSENRNRGSEKAKGEFIIFLDDDAVIEEKYLKKAEEFFKENPEIDIAGGVQLTPENDRGFAKISGYALSSLFGAWKISYRYSGKNIVLNADETMLTSANLICRKKVMEKIKFNIDLFPGEDPKFIADAKEAGFKIAYNPGLVIHHRRRPTIKGMAKQIFNYGKTRPEKESFFETLTKRPFFLIPSIFMIYLFLLIILIITSPSITGNIINIENIINPSITGNIINIESIKTNNLEFLLFFPVILYIILSILFAFYDSLKNKDLKSVFALPFIYFLIHLSYGAGMIYGFIFPKRKSRQSY